MKKLIYFAALVMTVLTSCEKELDIDYHNVDPLYVIEASINEDGAVARISQTLNVKDTLWNKSVDNAEIFITSDEGDSFTLHLDSAGSYSSNLAKAVPGHKYTIKVKIGDYETEATSEMQSAFNVEDTYMYKVQMMEDVLYCYRVDVEDDGSERNYYYALVTRNGKPYKWQVLDNRGFFGTLEIDVPCFMYCDLNDDDKDILDDGDEIDVEIRKVDRKTYDYLYALALAEETPSNPIKNFSNNTLGYFSACNVQKLSTLKYEKEAIEDFDKVEQKSKERKAAQRAAK